MVTDTSLSTCRYYIYHNLFWPWWKDVTGQWVDDTKDHSPTADPHLVDATSPVLPPTTAENLCYTMANIYHIFLTLEFLRFRARGL